MPNSWQCRALALLGALTIIFLLWPICCCAAKPTRSPILNTNSIPIQYSPLTTSNTLTDISTKINNSKEQKIQSETSLATIKPTTDMLEHNLIAHRSSHQNNMGYDKINAISDNKNGTKFDFLDTSNSNNYSRALNTVFNKLKLQPNDKNINHNYVDNDDNNINDVKSSRLTLLQDNTILTPSNTFLKSTTIVPPPTTSAYEIFNFTQSHNSPSKLGVLQRADRSVKNINNNTNGTNAKRNKNNSNKTKISHLDRNERSANLSHITGGARKIQLYIKNRFLQLLPDGTINGTTDDLSDFSEYFTQRSVTIILFIYIPFWVIDPLLNENEKFCLIFLSFFSLSLSLTFFYLYLSSCSFIFNFSFFKTQPELWHFSLKTQKKGKNKKNQNHK